MIVSPLDDDAQAARGFFTEAARPAVLH